MRPPLLTVMMHYPNRVKREDLYADIGWNDLIDNKAYNDTCAIRMSYSLLMAGVSLPGARMKAKAGVLKGRYMEPGQARLSNILRQQWGAPEVYKGEHAARNGIGSRTGVVSFFRIGGGHGGHIDLVVHKPGGRFQDCARVCFWDSETIWFWPLT
ncbi:MULTISPECIES: T6SS effector amidase Tae4 family protein [Massilia]|uniref:T6SS effector amidase Tae4 family protein n=1 Tax=Massilia TaxID=149698 RepID=UPI001C634EE6|nr:MULTISPECIES: T6SS effector amidase Tae4 family protein [Massilia]QYG01512.1 type VI secretion system amidase effector protein Tae4 [Massilia sp. NP310]